jgi:hypothetical protein
MPHTRCGWINDRDPIGNPAGVVSFQNNAGFFHAIHPLLYFIQDSTFALEATTQDPNHVIPSAAQAAGTALWPMIAGPSDIDGFGQLLNDPNRRDAHVQALVNELQTPLLVPGNPVYAHAMRNELLSCSKPG